MEDKVDKAAGVVAVVAGLIAAVKLSRVGIPRDSESESTGAIHHLGVLYDCPDGDRSEQSEGMTWEQVRTGGCAHCG
jgi:hypothetical protein